VNDIKIAINKSTVDYFNNYWVPAGALHDALEPIYIDRLAHEALASESNDSIIESFRPNDSGVTEKIVYDRFASRTGRLGVESGPKVLNLKKIHRHILTSKYGNDGEILSLDFNALEARIVLYEAGKSIDGDLYDAVARDVFPGNKMGRSTAKACVISELYGISQRKLAQKLNVSNNEAITFINGIKNYFKTNETIERLRKTYDAEGCIYNKFGRRLMIPDSSGPTLLNSFAQSTGADAAQLGFLNIIPIIKDVAKSARPLFILHDALILDIHKSDHEAIESIKQISVPLYDQAFILKCEKFNCTSKTS
jgi:transcriptional regulator with XRE-family HTH domain